MKSIPSVLAAPWAIEPQWLRVMFGVWSRGTIDAAALGKAKAEWEARKASRPRIDESGAPVEGTGGTLRIVGSVGVITIDGALFRHADMFTEISGGTTYDAIWRGLEAALSNRQVSGIMLRANSPGGEANGCSELGKGIRAAGRQKLIWTFGDGMVDSAMYWLASQTDRIVAEETCEAGSIGVRSGILDDSAHNEMHGLREIEIISSQSPGKRSNPVDDEVLARLQVRVDDLADRFIAAVAEGRGVDVETVLSDFGQGDVMIAGKALDAGLIDEIGNFNETLEALAKASSGTSEPLRSARAKGRISMARDKDLTAAATADGDEWQCAGCKESMGPSADAYCAKCAEDDDDDEEDGDEARALGLDPKSTATARRERMVALVDFEKYALATLGAADLSSARGALLAAHEARAELPKVREALKAETTDGIKRDLRSILKAGLDANRLSLGGIQKSIPRVLRGAEQTAWTAAMGALKKTTEESVLDAACSVALGREDVKAIAGWVTSSDPIAAAAFEEPPRDADAESNEIEALDETALIVKNAAAATRKHLDRGKAAKAK